MYRVGVDVGGTFTDICCIDDDTGELRIAKVPSTPLNQALGVCMGISRVIEQCGESSAVSVGYLAHGTTVATNAVLERRGATVGCVVTRGFRDLLEIGRQRRPHLYDLYADKPAPLVPRNLRVEVEERLLPSGEPLQRLDPEAVRSILKVLNSQAELQALAICLLYSFGNGEHERIVQRVAEEVLPGIFISSSHDVCPEIREFERLSTTCLNAYVGPVMNRYLRHLEKAVSQYVAAAPLLMQSNGGLITVDEACRYPVRTLFSGPAAGVVGARYFGQLAGFRSLITLDIGGTSADISFVQEGRIAESSEGEIEGWPVKVPMVNIHSIGAGGGSIAHVDPGGLLKVGPASAGASPGPACYGRGGVEPCVTDAQVVLGRLNPGYLVGGDLKLDYEAAVRAVGKIAETMKVDLTAAASGVISVTRSNLVRAMRRFLAARGLDPRDFALLAYGGAGPLHAAELAEELGISTVIIPPIPGVLCAFGLLVAGVRRDFVATSVVALNEGSLESIMGIYRDLEGQAIRWAQGQNVDVSRASILKQARMRYRGQGHELSVTLTGDLTSLGLRGVLEAFHREHKRCYGFDAPDETVEFVTAVVSLHADTLARPVVLVGRQKGCGPKERLTRTVFFDGGPLPCPIYRREELPPGEEIKEPAVVEQLDATVLVPPGWQAHVDRFLNLVLARR